MHFNISNVKILQLKFNQIETYYETNINNMNMCLCLSTNSYNTLNKYARKNIN